MRQSVVHLWEYCGCSPPTRRHLPNINRYKYRGTIFLHHKKTAAMKPEVNYDNTIFMYTFLGVLLMIGALGLVANSFVKAGTEGFAYSIAGILGISSLALLTKAIRNDRVRLR
jgi:hypothetical protein